MVMSRYHVRRKERTNGRIRKIEQTDGSCGQLTAGAGGGGDDSTCVVPGRYRCCFVC